MASEPPKVFISYSHDSPEHAQHVLELAERLRADGIDAQLDQYIAGTPVEGWPRWMLDQVQRAEFVLVVCTETYYRRFRGHEEPGKGRGADWEGNLITVEIYDAKSRTTKFKPVLLNSKDESFIPEPLRCHTRYLLSSENNYANLYAVLSGQAGITPGALGSLKTLARNPVEPLRFESPLVHGRLIGKLHGVPDLPPHYLPREEELTRLKSKLLAKGANVRSTGQSSAMGVYGMGGIGKTVLAAALAQDLEVRQSFPDGIFWLTIGQWPDLLDLQNQLLVQLTGFKLVLATPGESKNAYEAFDTPKEHLRQLEDPKNSSLRDQVREKLEGKCALVILDDAWTIDQAYACSVTALPARTLITTRNNEVLVNLGAEEDRLDLVSSSDALKMLTQWVGGKNPDEMPAEATEVARECGYLPLALAMIGAMIRSHQLTWTDALIRLRRVELEAIKRKFPGYQYADLLRAITVSIEALEETDRERYLDLAVFPRDHAIPETALCVLWNLDELDTRYCRGRLLERSLATSTDAGTSLILHDLQYDVIRKSREKKLRGLHLRLVEAWDALPKLPDAYAWRWVAYHLVQSGREDDLRQLLLNFDYLQTKLTVTNTNALIADYGYLQNDADLETLQSVLSESAHILAGSPLELPGQLISRLSGSSTPGIDILLSQASEHKSFAWLRPLATNTTTLNRHNGLVYALAVTPDGRHVVSSSADKTVRIWDLTTGETKTALGRHTSWVYVVAVTPGGRYVISGCENDTLYVWDLVTGEIEMTLQGHRHAVLAVAVTPDGRHVVSGSADNTLRVWDMATGKTKTRLQGHTDSVRTAAVTPDGRHVVSGSDDNTLRVWDLESGQSLRTLEGHTGSVSAVTVTLNGHHVVSGSADNTLRVWDLASGKTKTTLLGHTDSVRAAAVTPDGCHLVSGSTDHTLRVWDLKNEKEILRFTLDREVTASIVAQANQIIVAGDGSGRLHFLQIVEADKTKPAIGASKVQLLRRRE